ncbi:hypothetical protein HK097_009513, partial [Rhizophlyctis rosea]
GNYCTGSFVAQKARCNKMFSKRDLGSHRRNVDKCVKKAEEIRDKCNHAAEVKARYPLLREQGVKRT